jgi:hypothetical protein
MRNKACIICNICNKCIGLCEADIVRSSYEGMYLKWGTVGGRGKGNGEQMGGGGQFTANQGSGWTGIAPRRKGGIPSK